MVVITLPCQRDRHIRCAGAVITGPDTSHPHTAIGCSCACHLWLVGNPVTATITGMARRQKRTAPSSRRLGEGAVLLSTTTMHNSLGKEAAPS